MSALPRDPLLAAARVILTLLMVATLAAAVACAGAAGLAVIDPAVMLAWLGRVSGDTIPATAARPLSGALALLSGMSLLSFLAQRVLRRVIDSVGQGDPFIPDNARQLAAMAWLTVGIQALSIGVASLIGWSSYVASPLQGQFGFSLGGVLLSLVLFILARVFRQGATMREELEGTV
jgi:hypothetical protein